MDLVTITSQEIRKADPDAKVIGGVFSGMPEGSLRGSLELGLADYVNIISHHPLLITIAALRFMAVIMRGRENHENTAYESSRVSDVRDWREHGILDPSIRCERARSGPTGCAFCCVLPGRR